MIKRKSDNKKVDLDKLFDLLLSEDEQPEKKDELKDDEFIKPAISEYNKFDRFVKEENLKISVFFVALFFVTCSFLVFKDNNLNNVKKDQVQDVIPINAEYGFENVIVIPSEKGSLRAIHSSNIEKKL